jgi:hypothetical protein
MRISENTLSRHFDDWRAPMNDPILASGGAGDERRSRSRREESATHYNRVRSLVRVLGALIGALVFYLVLASPANAAQIKVHCEVYATNHVDPIAFAHHLHRQIGNTSTTNESTGKSLFNNHSTSCDQEWFTSAGWFPVERYESVTGVNVYYRAHGDQKKIKAIPKGLQLLATEQKYVCNGDGSGSGLQSTPVYGCKYDWATSVAFPDCINTSRLADEATNAVNSRSGVCPSTHPYRIPEISFLVMHANADGRVPKPLTVSMGEGEWGSWSNMHADYFAANQPALNEELLDLCLRDAPEDVHHADPRCGRKP